MDNRQNKQWINAQQTADGSFSRLRQGMMSWYLDPGFVELSVGEGGTGDCAGRN